MILQPTRLQEGDTVPEKLNESYQHLSVVISMIIEKLTKDLSCQKGVLNQYIMENRKIKGKLEQLRDDKT